MDASGFSEGRNSPSKCVPCSRAATLVNEVAFDVRRGLQHHLLGTHRADKAATDHHILSRLRRAPLAFMGISRALTCYDGNAINTNTKLTLVVLIVFFLALALAALWML